MLDIGKVIQNHLELKNMTQSELGQHIGLSQKAISKYVTGKSQPPLDVLEKIMIVLNISPYEIFSIKNRSDHLFIASKDEQDLIRSYRNFSSKQKIHFIEIVSCIEKMIK